MLWPVSSGIRAWGTTVGNTGRATTTTSSFRSEVGETASITAAWVRFPELDVVASEQRYTRLGNDRWQYRSGDYDYELVTDETTGLVLSYGDDLWRAVATSFG